MSTRIMAVVLVGVSLLGVRAAQAQGETVKLVRASTIGSPLEGSLVGSDLVIIVIGPTDAGSSSFAGCGDLGNFDPWENIEVVVIRNR